MARPGNRPTRPIRVDDDVYEYIQRHAVPFKDTPNTTLRRLLQILDEPEDDGAKNNE